MTGVARRILLGLACGAGVAGVLGWWLAESERRDVASARLAAAPPAPEFRVPPAVPAGTAWLLYVVGLDGEVPSTLAPCVAIRPGGTVSVIRGAPSPEGPEPEPWLAAGIVLPARRVADLDPAARAALLAMLWYWRGTVGRGSDWRAVQIGIDDPDAFAALVRWER